MHKRKETIVKTRHYKLCAHFDIRLTRDRDIYIFFEGLADIGRLITPNSIVNYPLSTYTHLSMWSIFCSTSISMVAWCLLYDLLLFKFIRSFIPNSHQFRAVAKSPIKPWLNLKSRVPKFVFKFSLIFKNLYL